MAKRKAPPRCCPYPDCNEPISRLRFFCWKHWSALPMHMQRELRETCKSKGRHKAVELVPIAIKVLGRNEKRNNIGGDT